MASGPTAAFSEPPPPDRKSGSVCPPREALLRSIARFARVLSAVAAILALTLALAGSGGNATPAPRPGHAPAAGRALTVRTEDVSLVMVEERGCRFCMKWDAEVGKGYTRTAEGRAAPLRRVRRGAGVLKGLAPVVYTPTFILMRRGEELGRITGYPGQLYFWEELTQMMSASGIGTGG